MTIRLNEHTDTARKTGARAEHYALAYLKSQGLVEVCSNYHSRYGEIDLVMEHGDILVFIEVRHRSNDQYMDPLESIDARKINRIIRTSQDYLQRNITSPHYCRFDIITLTGTLDKPVINWIQGAFDANI